MIKPNLINPYSKHIIGRESYQIYFNIGLFIIFLVCFYSMSVKFNNKISKKQKQLNLKNFCEYVKSNIN